MQVPGNFVTARSSAFQDACEVFTLPSAMPAVMGLDRDGGNVKWAEVGDNHPGLVHACFVEQFPCRFGLEDPHIVFAAQNLCGCDRDAWWSRRGRW